MATPLRFDGKVVLVTGAGNGLGRAYALAFAERGASVVVNDLGGDHSGGGASVKAADKVVFEIKTRGGKAVANYDSVENGDKVVKTALDAFGRIDIVINNAGILRDKSFARISDEDWDLIHRVHLRGSFMVTRAAWPHMKKQKYGRVILVSSAAGIYGNFGQANYSSAKLGLAGMCNTLAIEGRKDNIQCNTIAPIAGSRMTETVMPKDILDTLKPEYVAPLVVYLCHESCYENGSLFEVGGGWIGKLRWERTQGALLREAHKPITAETVRDKWEKITDFSVSTYPSSTQESSGHIIQLVNQVDEEERNAASKTVTDSDDPVEKAKAFKPADTVFKYDERDVILYALGVGASTKQEGHLQFLFEMSDDFTVLPTFGVIPAFSSVMSVPFENLGGLSIDPTKILHGEQYLELFKPFSRSGTLKSTLRVADIVDKKIGALLIYNIETFDEKGEKVAFNQFVTFAVGSGNFGGPKTSKELIPLQQAPKRNPDASMSEKTSVDQAALYRLSGDSNPLHIDPAFAAMGGFKTPILHGLCSFGHSVRHVMAAFANNDMNQFKAVKVRFVKPVLPGQTVQTDMWKEGNRIHFQTKVVENNTICISGAYVDLHQAIATVPTSAKEESSGLECDETFEQMASMVTASPDIAKKVNAKLLWNITKDGAVVSTWTVDMKTEKGEIYKGKLRSGKPDCTMTVSDDVFSNMVTGKTSPQNAFMSGKLKLTGNIKVAMRLGSLFSTLSKL